MKEGLETEGNNQTKNLTSGNMLSTERIIHHTSDIDFELHSSLTDLHQFFDPRFSTVRRHQSRHLIAKTRASRPIVAGSK
jgi:hypothetical protein